MGSISVAEFEMSKPALGTLLKACFSCQQPTLAKNERQAA